MDGKTLQQLADDRAEELPGSELTHPFGEDWEVFKVRGKVFMLHTDVTGEPIVILKAAPADVRSLQTEHEDISPGYHMNKRHWITLHPDGGLGADLVEDLVTESYLLVLEHSVPKSQWPVDPSTYGQTS
ncbi:MmcQ/YjbR family DNA-binding protein [Actinomycetota bacterium]